MKAGPIEPEASRGAVGVEHGVGRDNNVAANIYASQASRLMSHVHVYSDAAAMEQLVSTPWTLLKVFVDTLKLKSCKS